MTLPPDRPPGVSPREPRAPREGEEGGFLTRAGATPVTSLLLVAAAATSYVRWQDPGGGAWALPLPGLMLAEPWRWVTSWLAHGGWLHLLFNAWFLWYFGRTLELRAGPARTLALYVLIGLGSSAAQLAFSGPGIGLSGIGFGVFAYLAVAAKLDPRFAGVVERRDVVWVAGWALIFVYLTATGALNIGNTAHGAGAALGAAFALAASTRAPLLASLVPATLALALVFFGATLRSYLPVGDTPQLVAEAWRALEAEHAERAGRLAARAVEQDALSGAAHEVLGVARIQGGRPAEAIEPLRRAIELYRARPGTLALGRSWWNLGVALQDAGLREEAEEAIEAARSYGFDGRTRPVPGSPP